MPFDGRTNDSCNGHSGSSTVLLFPYLALRFLPRPRLPYNLLTLSAFVLSIGLVALVWKVVLNPEIAAERIRKASSKKGKNTTASDAGVLVGRLGSALATTPILYGYILALFSRDLWRFLIFLPVAIAIGIVAWKQGRRTLEHGVESGAFR